MFPCKYNTFVLCAYIFQKPQMVLGITGSLFKQLVIASEILNGYSNIRGLFFFFQIWKCRRNLEQISWKYSCLELCESLQKNALLIFLTKVQENTFNINKWLKEAKVQIDLWDHLLQDFSKCGLQLASIGYLLKCRFRGPFPDLLNQNLWG